MPPTEWINGLAGGALIGAGGAVLLLGAGRIMGASGVVVGALQGPRDRAWSENLVFLIALVAAPTLLGALWRAPAFTSDASVWLMAAAGLIVGVGSRLGSGCTSGHGVCGMSRLSARSLVATATFMLTAAVVVFLTRHTVGG